MQSLLFARPRWTAKTATRWASSHGFAADSVDVKPATIRLRQWDPAEGDASTFRTIPLGEGEGIQAVVATRTRGVARAKGDPARSPAAVYDAILTLAERANPALAAWMLPRKELLIEVIAEVLHEKRAGEAFAAMFPRAAREHAEVRALLEQSPLDWPRLNAVLEAHAQFEDGVVFPHLRAQGAPDAVLRAAAHATSEHPDIREGARARDPNVRAKILHHFDEEERDLYGPAALAGFGEPPALAASADVRNIAELGLSQNSPVGDLLRAAEPRIGPIFTRLFAEGGLLVQPDGAYMDAAWNLYGGLAAHGWLGRRGLFSAKPASGFITDAWNRWPEAHRPNLPDPFSIPAEDWNRGGRNVGKSEAVLEDALNQQVPDLAPWHVEVTRGGALGDWHVAIRSRGPGVSAVHVLGTGDTRVAAMRNGVESRNLHRAVWAHRIGRYFNGPDGKALGKLIEALAPSSGPASAPPETAPPDVALVPEQFGVPELPQPPRNAATGPSGESSTPRDWRRTDSARLDYGEAGAAPGNTRGTHTITASQMEILWDAEGETVAQTRFLIARVKTPTGDRYGILAAWDNPRVGGAPGVAAVGMAEDGTATLRLVRPMDGFEMASAKPEVFGFDTRDDAARFAETLLDQRITTVRALPNRGLWPDGRAVAVPGDKVYRSAQGFGGTAASISGTVYLKSGAKPVDGELHHVENLRVQDLTVQALIGGGGAGAKTQSYDHNWTLNGDPWVDARARQRAAYEPVAKAKKQAKYDKLAALDREVNARMAAWHAEHGQDARVASLREGDVVEFYKPAVVDDDRVEDVLEQLPVTMIRPATEDDPVADARAGAGTWFRDYVPDDRTVSGDWPWRVVSRAAPAAPAPPKLRREPYPWVAAVLERAQAALGVELDTAQALGQGANGQVFAVREERS